MRRFLNAFLLAIALVATGCSSMGSITDTAVSDSLVSSLGKLNMTPSQATGSLGSLVSLASNRLSPADFAKFSGYLPNADKYLKSAEAAGLLKTPVMLRNWSSVNVVSTVFLADRPARFTVPRPETNESGLPVRASNMLLSSHPPTSLLITPFEELRNLFCGPNGSE